MAASSIQSTISNGVQDAITYLSQRPQQATGIALTTSSLALLAFIFYDYNAWRSFGTGGTPPTPSGYWRMTKIRFTHTLFGEDMLDTSTLDTNTPSYLPSTFKSKIRSGKRPQIMARTMPQRQHPYPSYTFEPGVKDSLATMMQDLASAHPDLVTLAPSKTEGGSTTAIYVRKTLSTLNPLVTNPRNKMLDGEIAHAHPAEQSLHVWLSQSDAKMVVDQGWGSRFPLTFVDKGWTMVYAPQTREELGVVEEIVRAGMGWLSGVRV